MRALFCAVIGALSLVACGDDGSSGADAGADGGFDGGTDAGFDAGPECEPACGAGVLCCPGPDGIGQCVNTRTDIHNCGLCGIDCLERESGTVCEGGTCRCGASVLGCSGTTVCCPPRPGLDIPYCANFARDPEDCGGCDQRCDPSRADRCDGAQCLCGDGSRRQCDGTAEDMCCADALGTFECVDTTSDRRHCGECGSACDPGFRCEGGECVGI